MKVKIIIGFAETIGSTDSEWVLNFFFSHGASQEIEEEQKRIQKIEQVQKHERRSFGTQSH